MRSLNKFPRTIVKASIIGIVISLAFEFVGLSIFFNSGEIDACKEFIRQNPEIKQLFGNIEGIRLLKSSGSRSFSWDSKTGNQSNGNYIFHINGTLKSWFVKIKWKYEGAALNVIQVSIPVGLFRSEVLRPGLQFDQGMIASTRIWSGIASLLLSALLFLIAFVFTEKNNKSVNMPSKDSIKNLGKWLFLITGFSVLTKSILCFVGFSLLL